MISILFENPILFVLVALALILSLSIHEFSHAFVSDKLGDPTARYLGRVTLNPLAHLDPVGTAMLLFVGFGWGRPVPFNPINLSNPKRDAALISFAGPLSNFLLAALMALILHVFNLQGLLAGFFYLTITFNLMLGFFNLIPVHPLDGFKVIYGLLPSNLAVQWQQMESYGIVILIIMLVTSSTSRIIQPLVGFSLQLLGF